MGDNNGHQPVELYGIIEIATALGEDRRKIAVWHGRGKLPPADFRASGRPFWKSETVTPWIASQTGQTAAPAPAAAAEPSPAADQLPSPTPAPASSTAEPSLPPSGARVRSRRWAPSAEAARPASRARGRRAPAVDQDQGGEDPYALSRSSEGWTLTYLGESIGTVRPAWSAT